MTVSDLVRVLSASLEEYGTATVYVLDSGTRVVATAVVFMPSDREYPFAQRVEILPGVEYPPPMDEDRDDGPLDKFGKRVREGEGGGS